MSEMLARPGLRPAGPIISAAAAGIWSELSAARAAVEAYELEARQEAERQQKDACRDGLARGLEQAGQVVDQATRSVEEMLADLERRLPAFATEVVIEMLGQVGPAKTMASMARRAVRSFRDDAILVCKVHPDLVDPMQAALASEAEAARLHIRADTTQDLLGCRLETEFASVDLSLDRQIERLRRSFADALSREA